MVAISLAFVVLGAQLRDAEVERTDRTRTVRRDTVVDAGNVDGREIGAGAGNSTGKLTIYWTRHALSCANLRASTFNGRRGRALWPEDDPVVSNCGEYQAAAPKDELVRELGSGPLDGVFSSSMVRAAQTAHLMFGGTVGLLPYISEVPNGMCWGSVCDRQDYPEESVEAQRSVLANAGVPVDFRFIGKRGYEAGEGRVQRSGPRTGKKSARKRAAVREAMSDFLGFVRQELLPSLSPQEPGHARIAVASHGTFLKLAFGTSRRVKGVCSRDVIGSKVHNLQVFAVEYAVSGSGITPVGCRGVYDGAEKPADICAEDFASCTLGGRPLRIQTGQCECMQK